MWSPSHDLSGEGTKLSIAFSPCPNDTFIMDALVHDKIDTKGIKFIPHLMDIQQLNENALAGTFEITKISAAVFPLIQDKYDLLDAGAAMGFGVGPILVSKKPLKSLDIHDSVVAIPGKNTTANLLFHHFYAAKSIYYAIFSDIETLLLDNKIDAGVLIHEGRFTYKKNGLQLIADLGTLWEEKYNLPIPLGIWVVKKHLSPTIKNTINENIKNSVQYAFDNPSASKIYVSMHAQEMNEEVQRQHIELYVNKYSLGMGANGSKALDFLLKI